MHCCYILNSVRFQTKSSLVWKSDSKNVVTIFQTKPSLVWKLKMLSQISKPNPVWFGNFLCRICGGNKFQTKSSLVWKFSKLILVWFGNIIFQLHKIFSSISHFLIFKFLTCPRSNILIKILKKIQINSSLAWKYKIFFGKLKCPSTHIVPGQNVC